MEKVNSLMKILLVDDTKHTRESLSDLFQAQGYSVAEAGSADEALKLLEDGNGEIGFALVDQVLDRTLESGTQAVKQISDMRPDLFIVMYTADPEIKDIHRWNAMKSGAHRYIRKANAGELLRDIDEFIQDMSELQDLTRIFKGITSGRLEMASAIIGIDVGITLIDREYRIWFANKTQADIVGTPNIVGAPCWKFLHGCAVNQGQCFGCSVKEVFESGQTSTRTFLSRSPSWRLEWLQVVTTPIFTKASDKPQRVIAAKKATQRLDSVVKEMKLADRLRYIAQGIVFAGYGRARIYQSLHTDRLTCVAAAAGPDSKADQDYLSKVSGFVTSEDKTNPYVRKAMQEMTGTLHLNWDPDLGEDANLIMQLDLNPPWIDLPVWNEKELIGWLGVDIKGGRKSCLDNEDIQNLKPFAEEIIRAFMEAPDASGPEKPDFRKKVSEARIKVAGAQGIDEALQAILDAVNDITPCRDVVLRIREDRLLRFLKGMKGDKRTAPDAVSVEGTNTLTGYVVRSSNPYFISDYQEHIRRIDHGERLLRAMNAPEGPSLAILPLMIEWTCFGTMRIEPKERINWDEPGLKPALAEIASLAALIVRDISINRELAEGKAAAERELAQAFGAIHGIKGPVNAVRTYIQLIDLGKTGKITLEDAARYAERAGLCLDRVQRLADRLLRLVRPRQKEAQYLETNAFLETCIRENHVFYPNLTIESDISSDAQSLYAEPGEFREVLDELVTNAAKAVNENGLVKITAKGDVGFVRVTVEDNGPGVPPDKLTRIFDRWYFDFPGGTGLGLSFVKQAVADLGGTVIAEPGNPGLRIVIRIPQEQHMKQ
ncbi:MAG: ATP-binding protein [Desulfosalsimonadaceae bacterium]